ncbi:MAG: ABC transporter ATP-binding protein [Acidimicrobiia bacterium]|nr:ABC transporter ATP-binding protein [Acidimicrobiia bacterium]
MAGGLPLQSALRSHASPRRGRPAQPLLRGRPAAARRGGRASHGLPVRLVAGRRGRADGRRADRRRRDAVTVGLAGRGVTVTFGRGHNAFNAVAGADIDVAEREVVGLVGESGSGKTTLGKVLALLQRPTAGAVSYRGETLEMPRGGARSEVRGQVQMIFQDPYSSLNPKQRALHAVAEVFGVWQGASRTEARAAAMALLREVGISEEQARLFPASLSGGQRQRVSVARALAVEPRILIADEPTSSIDQSAQAQLLVLLGRLQSERGLGILLITHDLRLIRSFADRLYVMRRGELVESGPTAQIFSHPQHPYTSELIEAIPGGMRH